MDNGRVYEVHPTADVLFGPKGYIQLVVGRTYRITAQVRQKAAPADLSANQVSIQFDGMDSSYSAVAITGTTTVPSIANGSNLSIREYDDWKILGCDLTVTSGNLAVWARYHVKAFANAVDSIVQIRFLKFEDVTESSKAQTFANASATSATQASTYADAAGNYAASISSNNTLTASVGLGGLIKNPSFTDYTNTDFPANWTVASSGTTPARVTGKITPFAMQISSLAATTAYVEQDVLLANSLLGSGQWCVIEADITLTAGTLSGSGIRLTVDKVSSGSDNFDLNFTTDLSSSQVAVGAGVVGQTYSFRKLIHVTTADPSSFHVLAISHLSDFGSIANANTIVFHRVSVRQASQGEIEGRVASASVVDLQATVTTQQSALVTLDGRTQAYWGVGVNAGSGANAFITASAYTSPGVLSSNIALGAREINIYNDTVSGYVKALGVSNGDVQIYGKLQVGSVTGDNLASGVLGTNLIANGSAESGAPDGWKIDTSSSHTGVLSVSTSTFNSSPSSFKAITSSGNPGYVETIAKAVRVLPSNSYVIRVWVKGDTFAASSFNVKVLESSTNTSDGYIASGVAQSTISLETSGQVPSIWTMKEYVYNPSSGVYWASLSLSLGSGSTVSSFYFDDVKMIEQVGSTVIADGAIKTNHMTANTISGTVITAGTLTADRITVGTGTNVAANQLPSGLYVGNSGSTISVVQSNASSAFTGTVNYRTTGAPTTLPTPTGITVTQNTNGTCNITLSWSAYTQGSNKADFLILFWRKDASAPAVTDASVTMSVNTSLASYYVFEGVNPADVFSFGIAAARRTENGLEVGTIQSPTSAPNWRNAGSLTPTYTATIGATATINGTAASTVTSNAASGATAFTGTAKYRTTGAPTNIPSPTGITVTTNTNGTINIRLDWSTYTQGTNQADALLIIWKKGATSPVITDSAISFDVNTTGGSYYIFEGVNPADTYSFGIAAGRRTENGFEVGSIASPSSAPTWINVGNTTPNFTANINGTTAATVVTNASSAFSGTVKYRTSGAPTNNPTPSGITITTNTNGTINARLDWSVYTQGTNQADTLVIFWKKGTTAPTVTDSAITCNVNTVGGSYYIFEGINPADTYSFGIAAARRTENGLEIGAIQAPASAPTWLNVGNTTPTYTANIGATATINGVVASTVTTNAANGATAFTGTAKYRTTGAPTNSPAPSAITITTNTNGSINIRIDWTTYLQGTNQADSLLILWKKGATSPVITDSAVICDINTTAASYYIFEGVNPADTYSFGVAAARRTENGLEVGSIISPSSAPTWINVGNTTPNFTANINGTTAATVVTNASSAFTGTVNYRTTGAPTNNVTPSGITITTNTNGTINARLDWSVYTQGTNQADTLVIFWKKGSTAPVITDSAVTCNVNTVGGSYYIFEGINPADTYSFGIAAARRTENGMEIGTIVAPASAPAWLSVGNTTPNYTANIGATATINGITATTLTSNAANGATAFTGTAKYRTTGAPTNLPAPSAIAITTNTNGTINIRIDWTTYVQGTNQADSLLILWKKGSTSPVITDSAVICDVNTSGASYYIFEGVNPADTYSFGIAAGRRTENGLEVGTIVSPSSAPTWINVGNTTPNFTANINGTTAATVVTNASSAFSGTVKYRTNGAPTNNPVPSGITTTTNTNGTINARLDWSAYIQGTNQADTLVIFWKKGSTAPTVTDSAVTCNVNVSGASYYIFEGINPADTYSFGIAAARRTENGLEIGTIQSPVSAPTWVNYGNLTPNFTANINGVAASTVTTNAANGASAYTGTTKYRTVGSPSNAPVPNDIQITYNSNGSINVRLGWAAYSQGTNQADTLVIFWNKTTSAPIAADSAITCNVNTTGSSYYIFEGVNPADTYSFGIAAARRTENGLEVGTIVSPSTAPAWINVGNTVPNYTANVGGVSATTVVSNAGSGAAAATGTLNYRTTGFPSNNPTPTNLAITTNTNGTCNITLTWSAYTQGTRQADFLMLFWRKDGSAPTAADSSLTMNVNTGSAAYYVFEGVNPADTYSFGIAAVRRTENGLEIATIVSPTSTPNWRGVSNTTPVYTATIGGTATVNGTSASTLTTNAANGATAFTGTAKYRTTGAPTNVPAPSGITVTTNTNGTINIRIDWTIYTQGTNQADSLLILWKKGATSPTITDSAVICDVNTSGASYYIFEGVNPADTYSFGIAAGRRTENGLEVGTIASPSSAPTWINVGNTTPNFTANINGTTAATVVTNASSAFTGTVKYRTTGSPTNNPTPSGITITTNTNGTINARLDWSVYTQGTNQADTLVIFWKKGSTAPTVTDSAVTCNVNTIGGSYYIFEGINPADTYSFGIASARRTENGLEIGSIQAPASAPTWLNVGNTTPTYTATIGATATINGVTASTVTTNAANGATAFTGTAKYRTTGAPTNVPAPSAITTTTNTNGTINIRIDWTVYTQGTNQADNILILWKKGATSPVITDSAVICDVNTTGGTYYIFEGVNPADTYSFGIAAARRTENGLEVGTIASPSSAPTWVNVGNATPNFTANINGTTAATVVSNASNGATAFTGTVNYRTTGAPTNNPTPSAITITTNTNGTINARIDWSVYTQGTNQADTLVIFWKKGSTAPTVTDSAFTCNVNTVGGSYYIFEGINPADTYSFGIAAARRTENGLEIGTIQSPSTTPAWQNVGNTTPNYTANIGAVATINGVTATTLTSNAANGATAFTGTAKYRTTGAPTNIPAPSAITVTTNSNGSINIRIDWASYTQGTNQADNLLILWKKGSTSPVITDSAIICDVNTSGASYYIFEGVNPADTYSFGIAAARRTENGLEVGTIASPSSAPTWINVGNTTPNYTANIGATASINGVVATTLTSNAANGATAFTGTSKYRTTGAPTNLPAPSAIAITTNSNGTINIRIDWTTYVQGTNQADALLILWKKGATSPVITDSAIICDVNTTAASYYIFEGVNPADTYSFGIAALRRTENGNETGTIVSPSSAPTWINVSNTTPNFTANVNGVSAATVTTNAANGATAFTGTVKYRTTGSPTNNPSPSAFATTVNSNGSMNIRLDWSSYVQGTNQADTLVIFWKKGSTSPTFTDSAITCNVNTTGSSYYIFEGINPADTYSFGIAAARRTENGLEVGTIISPSSAPNWINVGNTTPNFTANIGGTVAATVVANAALGASDPATRINAASTTIDPGRILISGTTLLSNWRNGTDTTKIEGGSIAANTISANTLYIGARGIDISGLEFTANWSGSVYQANRCYWTAGSVGYLNDAAVPTTVAVSAGFADQSPGAVTWIYWAKGASTLSSTTTQATAYGSNNIVVATYAGGTDLVVFYGRTVVDGSKITTGTITAANIAAGTITASQIATGAITISSAGVLGGAGTGSVNFAALAPVESAKIANTNLISLTAIGSVPPTISGNSVTKVGTNGFNSAAIAPACVNSAFIEARHALSNNGIRLALGTDKTTLDNINGFYAQVYGTTYDLYWNNNNYRSGALAAGNDASLIRLAYDGVSLQFYVDGLLVYSYSTGITSGLTLYPKVMLYYADTFTNINAGTFTDNSWANTGGAGKPADGATANITLKEYLTTGYYTIAGNNPYRTNASGSWEGVVASEPFPGSAYVQCVNNNATSTSAMVGLSDTFGNATSNQSYVNLNYAFFVANGTGYQIYESGSQVGTTYGGAITLGDVLLITYDGANVTYYINGVSVRTTATTTSRKFRAAMAIRDSYGSAVPFKNISAGFIADTTKLVGIQTGATVGAPAGTNVGSTPAATVENYALDPAARVNAYTTTITGGKITTGTVTALQIAANTITSGQIAANTITAGQIAAGAITAEKILIGTFQDNLILNGGGETGDTSGWVNSTYFSTDSTMTATSAQAYGGVYSITSTKTASGNQCGFRTRAVPIIAGRTYNLKFAFRSAQTANAIYVWPSFGPAVGGTGIISGGTTVVATGLPDSSTNFTANTWYYYDTTLVAPTGTNFFALDIFSYTGSAALTIYIDSVQFKEQVSTTQIADGAITTNKIVANAITAAQIAAGTITASQIAAGTITTTQIQAGTITGDRFNTGTSLPGTITVGSTGVSIATMAASATTVGLFTLYEPNAAGRYSVTANSATRLSGGSDWDAFAATREAASGSALLSFNLSTIGTISGLAPASALTTTSGAYTLLSYAIYWSNGDGYYYYYENGSAIALGASFGGVAFTTSTVFLIRYDGSTVKYYADGVLMRSVGAAANQVLYAAFASVGIAGKSISNISFATLSDPATVINTNTTTISGGKITTGTVTALQIAANTITATQLAILSPVSSLINNGNAELGDLTGWQKHHTYNDTDSTISVVATQQNSGTYSFSLAKTAASKNAGIMSKAIPLVAGKTYTLQLAIKASVAVTTGIFVRLEYCRSYHLDANGYANGQGAFTDLSGYSNGALGTSWTNLTLQNIPTNGYDYLVVTILSYTATNVNTVVYVDDVNLYDASGGGVYIAAGQIRSPAIAANAITADKIAVGTITALQLSAGAITADKLAIGTKSQDMLLNGGFEAGTTAGWRVEPNLPAPSSFAVSSSIKNSGSYSLALDQTAASYGIGVNAKAVPVTPGKVYTLRWYDRGTATTTTDGGWTAAMYYSATLPTSGYIGYADTSSSTNVIYFLNSVNITSIWTLREYTWTCPAGIYWASPFFQNYNTTNVKYIDDVQMFEQVTGTMIADGAITTSKIFAGAVTTNSLAAGSVTAGIIAAGAITASKLAVGSVSQDLLINGGAESGDTAGWRDDPNRAPGGTFACTSTAPISGSYCFSLTCQPSSYVKAINSLVMPVSPGKTYAFRYWVRWSATQTANAQTSAICASATLPVSGYLNETATSVTYLENSVNGTSTWTLKEFVWTCPAGMNWASVFFMDYNGGALVMYVDDVQFIEQSSAVMIADGAITANKITANAITADKIAANSIAADKLIIGLNGGAGQNLINNPGGEDGTTAGWKVGSFNGNGTFSNSSAQANSGGRSFLLAKTTTGDVISARTRPFPVTGGKIYSIRGALKGGAAAASGVYIRIYLWTAVDANGNETAGGNNVDPAGYANTSVTTSWVQFDTNITIPAGNNYTHASLEIINYINGPTSLWFDDISFMEPVSGTVIADGAITTAKITANAVTAGQIAAGTITATEIQAGSISGDRISTSTSLPGTITVGVTGVSIGTIQTQADDPAARVNAKTTQITPGLIQISGSTTLANWRNGTDNTKIEGGSIAANTITANKITIGNRAVTFTGIDFSVSTNGATLSWTAGAVQWVNDAGTFTTVSTSSGSTSLTGGLVYVYWVQSGTSLSVTQTASTANAETGICVATWTPGTKQVVATYGSTIIDGSRITTGSIAAAQITANTITASQIAAGTITATQIASNTINANLVNIGLRGVDVQGVEFTANWNGSAITTNTMAWTAGTIGYTDNSGTIQNASISAGSIAWTTGIQWVYWVQGGTTLSTTTSQSTAYGANNIVMATYYGGTQMIVTYGRTVIDGSKITTGTITADRITTGTTFTQDLYVGGSTFKLAGANGGSGKGALIITNAGGTVNLVTVGWISSSAVGFQLKNDAGAVLLDNTYDPNAIIADTLTVDVPYVTIQANYQGTVSSGQLPYAVLPKRTRGAVDVTSSSTWSKTDGSGITSTINSTTGAVSITAMTGTSATITVSSTYISVVKTCKITVTKNNAPQPPSSATSANTSSFNNVSSISYAGTAFSSTPSFLTVTAGSTGTVTLTAPLGFAFGVSSGYIGMYGKWQWRTTAGPGTWADVATEIYDYTDAYRPATRTTDDPASDGYGEYNQTKTGLTNGTSYDFQLLLRSSSAGVTLFVYNTATATGS